MRRNDGREGQVFRVFQTHIQINEVQPERIGGYFAQGALAHGTHPDQQDYLGVLRRVGNLWGYGCWLYVVNIDTHCLEPKRKLQSVPPTRPRLLNTALLAD